MRYFRKFGRRRVQRKRGIRRARPVRKVSKSVKRYVKRAIHRNIENKEWIAFSGNQSMSGAQDGLSNPSTIQLLGTISQGTGSGNRVGDNIKVVSGYIKGYVNLKPYDSVNNPSPPPCYVKIWLLRHLGINGAVSNPSTGYSWSTFFKVNSGQAGFQNNTLDLCLPVNDMYWKVLGSRTFKLGAGYASATGPVSTGAYFDNSPMSAPFYFNYAKHIKKVLKYNDATTNLPTNANIFIAFQPVNADGSSTVTPLEFHYTNYIRFEDA